MSGLKNKTNTQYKEIIIENHQPEEISKVDENVLNDMIQEAQQQTVPESDLPTLEDDKLFKKKVKMIPKVMEQVANEPDEPEPEPEPVYEEPEPELELELEPEPEPEPAPVKKTRRRKPKEPKVKKKRVLSQSHREALARGRLKALANRKAKAKEKLERKLKTYSETKTISKPKPYEEAIKHEKPREYISQQQFFSLMDNYNKYKSAKSKAPPPKPQAPPPKPKPSKYDIYFNPEAQIRSGIYGNSKYNPRYFNH